MMHTFRHIIFIFIYIWLSANTINAQTVFGKSVTVRYTDLTLLEMLIDMEKQTGVTFYYDPNVLPYYKLSFDLGTLTLYEALNKMLARHEVSFLAKGDDGLIICRKANISKAYLEKVIKRVDAGQMELPDYLKPLKVSASVGDGAGGHGKAKVDIRFVDNQSLEMLPGLSTQLMPGGKQCATDLKGVCRYDLEPGTYMVTGKLLGFRELELTLEVRGSGLAEVAMEQRLKNLQEVVIQGQQMANKVENNTTGIELLTAKEIKALPTFGGEADVIKSLSILPGVSSSGEGTSGFSVRGGGIDQNLVLQGNLPFLNTSHALGFYSVFNPDVVGNITLYKGDIPARYGGRLSSVLDVELKTPDFSEWKGSVSASTIAGKVALEGPLVHNKLAIVVGTRRSYSDWLLRQANLPEVKSSSAWFGDVVSRLQWRISERTSVSADVLHAADFFRFGKTFGYEWTTTATGLTVRHALSTKWVLECHYGLSNLRNNYFDQSGSSAFRLSGGTDIRKGHIQAKYLLREGVNLLMGVQTISYIGQAQSLRPYSDSSALLGGNVRGDRGGEWAAFAEGDIKITKKLNIKPGLRAVRYTQFGPGVLYNYEPGPLDPNNVTDSVVYAADAALASYQSLEPRIAVSYKIGENSSIKASYNRIQQFLHLISNTIGATPADVWQPSTRYIAPQVADNFSVGWARNRPDLKQEMNLEAFYKLTERVPVYKDFANLLLNDHLETELVPGQMRSYGAELSLRKERGRWNYQAAYTWSRVWQRTTATYPQDAVNGGQWFRGQLDQPHQLTLFGKWLRNPSNYITATFTYRTGKPLSTPRSGYLWGQVVIPYFDSRNNVRISNYHRFDLAYTYDQSQRKLDGLRYIFQISVYNFYGRENALSVFFKRNQNGLPTAYQFSPIGAAIPSAQLIFLI